MTENRRDLGLKISKKNYFDATSQHFKIVDFEVIREHQCSCILCLNIILVCVPRPVRDSSILYVPLDFSYA